VVFYHPEEHYFADAVEEATDWPENKVWTGLEAFTVADHEPGGAYPDLDAELLGDREGIGEADVLDLRGDTQEAADSGHALPALANHVYGNVYTAPGDNTVWLQYWFFYYYNDSIDAANTGFGKHEGDWEYVQYAYDTGTGQLTRATYNQHDHAETCFPYAFRYVVTDDGRTAPAVYVARNSHASYFAPGDYDLEITIGDFGDDHASAEAGPTELTLSKLIDEPWYGWEGHWGGTFGNMPGESTSPTGPGHGANEMEMVDPDRIAEDAKVCRQR